MGKYRHAHWATQAWSYGGASARRRESRGAEYLFQREVSRDPWTIQGLAGSGSAEELRNRQTPPVADCVMVRGGHDSADRRRELVESAVGARGRPCQRV